MLKPCFRIKRVTHSLFWVVLQCRKRISGGRGCHYWSVSWLRVLIRSFLEAKILWVFYQVGKILASVLYSGNISNELIVIMFWSLFISEFRSRRGGGESIRKLASILLATQLNYLWLCWADFTGVGCIFHGLGHNIISGGKERPPTSSSDHQLVFSRILCSAAREIISSNATSTDFHILRLYSSFFTSFHWVRRPSNPLFGLSTCS